MKKLLKVFILVNILFLFTGCSNKYIKEISYKEYTRLIDNKETFILEVMKTDCSACIDFKPKLTDVVNKYQIEIKYINTDHLTKEEYDELYSKTGIKGTPTVIFYTNGEEKTISSRINGSVSKDKIISKFIANGIIKED